MSQLCYSLNGGENFERLGLHAILEREMENWDGFVPDVIEADVREMTIQELADAVILKYLEKRTEREAEK